MEHLDFFPGNMLLMFVHERTWRRLFQKRVVCIKLDIYFFITINVY